MNPALEKMLREFEAQRLFGVVEIHYQGGVASAVHVKRTYKLSSPSRPDVLNQIPRETRGNYDERTKR